MSKQSFGTLLGDILTEWLLRHVEDVFYMKYDGIELNL